MQEHETREDLQEMGIMQHLEDLRWAVARCLVAVIVIFPFTYAFAPNLITFCRELSDVPLLYAHGPAEAFLQDLKIGIMLAIFVSLPFFLFQTFNFIAPGLYAKEQRWLRWSLFVSYFLFLGGALFGLFVITPMALSYLTNQLGDGVIFQPRLQFYLSFALQTSAAMGIVSQLPVVTVLLHAMGLVSLKQINDSRAIIVVGIFFAAAIITPPDIISQILLGVPTWGLFELSVIFCFLMERSKAGRSIKPITLMIAAIFIGCAVGGGSWAYYKKSKQPQLLPTELAGKEKDPTAYKAMATTTKGRVQLSDLIEDSKLPENVRKLSAESLVKKWHELTNKQKHSLIRWSILPRLTIQNDGKSTSDIDLTIERRLPIPLTLEYQWQINIDDGKEQILWPDSANNYRIQPDYSPVQEKIARLQVLKSLPLARENLLDGLDHKISLELIPVRSKEKDGRIFPAQKISSSPQVWAPAQK